MTSIEEINDRISYLETRIKMIESAIKEYEDRLDGISPYHMAVSKLWEKTDDFSLDEVIESFDEDFVSVPREIIRDLARLDDGQQDEIRRMAEIVNVLELAIDETIRSIERWKATLEEAKNEGGIE